MIIIISVTTISCSIINIMITITIIISNIIIIKGCQWSRECLGHHRKGTPGIGCMCLVFNSYLTIVLLSD